MSRISQKCAAYDYNLRKIFTTGRTQLIDMTRLLLLCTLVHGIMAQGTRTRCSAPPVYKGEEASLTCFFNEDVSQTNRNFKIYHLDPDTAEETAVLDCYWPEKTKVSCDMIAPGYRFNYTVSDYLTLTIPRATEDSVGTYECQVEPADPDYITPCTFTLKYGVKPAGTTSEAKPLSTTTAVTTLGTLAADDSSNSTGIVVAVVFTLIIVVAVLVLLFIFRKRARTVWTSFLERVRALAPENQRRERSDVEGSHPETAYTGHSLLTINTPGKRELDQHLDELPISTDSQSQSKLNQSQSESANYKDVEDDALKKPLLSFGDETNQDKTDPLPHNQRYPTDKGDRTVTTTVQAVNTSQLTRQLGSVKATSSNQSNSELTNQNRREDETHKEPLLTFEEEEAKKDKTNDSFREITDSLVSPARDKTLDKKSVQTVCHPAFPETTTNITGDEGLAPPNSETEQTPNVEPVPHQIKNEGVGTKLPKSGFSEEHRAYTKSTGVREKEKHPATEDSFTQLINELEEGRDTHTEDKQPEGFENPQENDRPSPKPHAPCRTLSQGSIETDKSGESMTEEVPIKSENNGTGSAVEDNGSQQGNESPEAEEGTQPTIDSDPASCNYKPQDTDYDEPSSLPVPASDESNDEESNTDKETEEQEASDGSDDDDDNSGNISKSLLAKFLHH